MFNVNKNQFIFQKFGCITDFKISLNNQVLFSSYFAKCLHTKNISDICNFVLFETILLKSHNVKNFSKVSIPTYFFNSNTVQNKIRSQCFNFKSNEKLKIKLTSLITLGNRFLTSLQTEDGEHEAHTAQHQTKRFACEHSRKTTQT